MDPGEFLRHHPPFDGLSEAAFAVAERALEVAFVPRGDRILRRADPGNDMLFVVRKGSVRLERDGHLIDILEEGDPFGYPSLLSGGAPFVDVVAEEDSLVLQLPRPAFQRLMNEPAFAEFFVVGLAGRLQRAGRVRTAPLAGDLTAPAGDLVARPPLEVTPDTTVRQAALLMRAEHVSSVLVSGSPRGIVTDRDLRGRVVAEGKPAETPVASVMSQPLRVLPAEAPLFEALLVMLNQRLHHLPVERDGQLVGVVTDTDLLRYQLKSPVYLLKRIDRLVLHKERCDYAGEVAGMVDASYVGGLAAEQIARLVSTLNDALVARLLRLAEQSLGPPPCAYAWIVFGSEGRKEQTLLTDQDNALVYAAAESADYFEALAQRVVGDLLEVGIPACSGGFMATHWCRPLGEWQRLFRSWLEAPEPEALLQAANFLDYRVVHGDLSLSSLETIVAGAPRQAAFLAHMARNAVGFRPPLGAFRRVRSEAGGVDLKKGGLMPIVSLARVLALEAGTSARATLSRLSLAADGGDVSRAGAETLAEAFRFFFRLRLAAQLRAARAGEPLDNRVRLEVLTPLERRHLKDSFQAVREMQSALAQRFGTDALGR